jgi:DNA topoisomerase IB
MMKLRMMRWTGNVERKGRRGTFIYAISMKTGMKETTRKKRRTWLNNIELNLREIGWGGIDWIDLHQDRTSGGFSRRKY